MKKGSTMVGGYGGRHNGPPTDLDEYIAEKIRILRNDFFINLSEYDISHFKDVFLHRLSSFPTCRPAPAFACPLQNVKRIIHNAKHTPTRLVSEPIFRSPFAYYELCVLLKTPKTLLNRLSAYKRAVPRPAGSRAPLNVNQPMSASV